MIKDIQHAKNQYKLEEKSGRPLSGRETPYDQWLKQNQKVKEGIVIARQSIEIEFRKILGV